MAKISWTPTLISKTILTEMWREQDFSLKWTDLLHWTIKIVRHDFIVLCDFHLFLLVSENAMYPSYLCFIIPLEGAITYSFHMTIVVLSNIDNRIKCSWEKFIKISKNKAERDGYIQSRILFTFNTKCYIIFKMLYYFIFLSL